MKIYIQIGDAPRSYRVKASTDKPTGPMKTGSYNTERYIPTVTFAVDVKFDRNIFRESIKSIAEFQLTADMIQSLAPLVDITESESISVRLDRYL